MSAFAPGKTEINDADFVSERVKEGASDNFHYAEAVNGSLRFLSKAASDLLLKHESGQFSPELEADTDENVLKVANACKEALKSYQGFENLENNTTTVEKLDRILKFLEGDVQKRALSFPLRDKVSIENTCLAVFASHNEEKKFDLAMNAELVYFLGVYVRLRYEQSQKFAKAIKSELAQAVEESAKTLDEILKVEDPKLTESDKETSEALKETYKKLIR